MYELWNPLYVFMSLSSVYALRYNKHILKIGKASILMTILLTFEYRLPTMIMTLLYHGTDTLFDEIDLTKAKDHKDFGRGFYLTTNKEQALFWAKKKSNSPNKNGYVYVYRLKDETILTDFINYKIRALLEYNRKWVDFVVKCRLEDFESGDDIIYDRMADSKHLELVHALEDYYEGEVSLSEVLSICRFSDTSFDQYCFKTQKVIDMLKRIEVISV